MPPPHDAGAGRAVAPSPSAPLTVVDAQGRVLASWDGSGSPPPVASTRAFRPTATGLVSGDGLAVDVADDGTVTLSQRGQRREAPVRVRGELNGRHTQAAQLVLVARSVE